MALERLSAWVRSLPDLLAQTALRNCTFPIADRMSCQSHTTAGLAIKAGASAIVKTGAAIWYGVVRGRIRTVAAATDMPALVGTVVNATFNTILFMIDEAGVRTAAMGVAGATLVVHEFAPIPEGKTVLGYIIINPTGTGNFVGGTTALDDATVVPNIIYVNVLGAFNPHILL
ncbi:MAG: hypothetical protein ABIU97_01790 [Dehalococcoidia bacterium]